MKALLSPCTNPLKDRGASSPSLRETWRAALSSDPDLNSGFTREKREEGRRKRVAPLHTLDLGSLVHGDELVKTSRWLSHRL